MKQDSRNQGPLFGLNVLDFGHYYAGPMTGMLLADQGANVIRIVKPGDRELPDQQYRLLNRNKNLLELDLKSKEGKELALSLIAKADVVIENFRPGVMKRLGLDYARVKSRNPGAVYLSIPGFASTDKQRASIQAWEGVVSAATGLYSDMHMIREILNYPPLYSSVPILSMYSAINGANAVMAALLARKGHGYGTVIEAPMSEAGLATAQGVKTTPFSEEDLSDQLKPWRYTPEDTQAQQLSKLTQAQQFTWGSNMLSMFFPCKDGRTLHIGTFYLPNIIERLLEALEIDQEVYSQGIFVKNVWKSPLSNNLSNPDISRDNWLKAEGLIRKALITKTADEWEQILIKANVMASKVQTRDEWMASQPMLDSGVHIKVSDGLSTSITPGLAVTVSDAESEGGISFRLPSPISEHQAEKLFDIQKHKVPLNGMPPVQQQNDLLDGIKVLDLANAIAGSIGGRVLAQYGAKVIRSESPNHMLMPLVGSFFVNGGKRSLLNDTTTQPGQAVLTRLLHWADIVTHNVVDGTTERLGIAPSQLHAVSPTTVWAQVSAFGGSKPGGTAKRVGYDFTAQAASGLMVQYGTLEFPHIHGGGRVADVVGGYLLAFGALLGLWQQREAGRGGVECRTSLAIANDYCQLPWMIAEAGNSDWGEPKGQFALGPHPWQRLYQCKDGWIYLGTDQANATNLAALLTDSPLVDEERFETKIFENTTAYWEETLNSAGIGCHKVFNTYGLYKTALLRSTTTGSASEKASGVTEIVCYENDPSGLKNLRYVDRAVRIGEEQSYYRLSEEIRYGEYTREILAEVGYTPKEIEDLIERRIVHLYYPPFGDESSYGLPLEKRKC